MAASNWFRAGRSLLGGNSLGSLRMSREITCCDLLSQMEINTENNWQVLGKDPKRKAKSTDPGWKYAFWPDIGNKDVVKCVLCGNENHSGINRFKQHLIGGFPDIIKCPKTTKEIAKEMNDFRQNKKSKKVQRQIVDTQTDDDDDEVQEINQARRCTTFIYRHGRVLDALREKTNGRDIVRAGATRFATAFLTLQSMYKNREPLRYLFCAEDWNRSKLAKTENGKKVCDTVFSSTFWNNVEECIQASQPLLVVLRIVDGDERPALAEIAYAMDFAKNKIKASFEKKRVLLNKVVKIIEDRWKNQMGKPLYGAALFLNPGRYFDVIENDPAYASRLREDFNDVLEKMITDRVTRNKISNYADDYKNSREGFAREMAIEHRKIKNPIDWWDAYGGRALELQSFAKRIVGLCCSSSGCERNWSTFEFIHTKKRNRLEHQRLNDLVYVQYNRKIDSRFKKRRELGRNFDPLVLDDFEWNNEWISTEEGNFWSAVDIAQGASHALEGRNLPRRPHGASTSHQGGYNSGGSNSDVNENDNDILTYTRRHTSFTLRDEDLDEEPIPLDDVDVEDDYGVPSPGPNNSNDDEELRDGEDLEIDDFA